MLLGEVVKEPIKKSNYTNEEVAEFIGITPNNLYRLFKKDSFELKYIIKISEKLGLSMWELIPGPLNITNYQKFNGKLTDEGITIVEKGGLKLPLECYEPEDERDLNISGIEQTITEIADQEKTSTSNNNNLEFEGSKVPISNVISRLKEEINILKHQVELYNTQKASLEKEVAQKEKEVALKDEIIGLLKKQIKNLEGDSVLL